MPIIALLPVWSAIKSGASSLFSFLVKPPGLYALIVMLLALFLWWFGQHEYGRGKADCQADHAAAIKTEVTRQIQVVAAVGDRSAARTARDQASNSANERVIDHVKDQAASIPQASNECVPADIADELRALN